MTIKYYGIYEGGIVAILIGMKIFVRQKNIKSSIPNTDMLCATLSPSEHCPAIEELERPKTEKAKCAGNTYGTEKYKK